MKTKKKIFPMVLSALIGISSVSVVGVSASAATIEQGKSGQYIVNNKAYVYNPELQIDLKVRTTADLNGQVDGYLYNFEDVKVIDSIQSNGTVWDKIMYNNKISYVSDAYLKHYISPGDNVVSISRNITKQFEVANSKQIAGNFDGQGLSLGYLQWCIGQGTLQPLLNRMDRQYNAEMRSVFGSNYDSIHNILLDTPQNQLLWAKSINNSSNTIAEPWYSQFVALTNNEHFKTIEADAEAYRVVQAMLICDKYNLKTIRGFALAFDVAVQNGSISPEAAKVIDAAIAQKPSMSEKDRLKVIANAVADTSTSNADDIRIRKMAIVNGNGTVHGIALNLDANYGISDNYWR
ncbi:SH3 domain-containing protein [Clostridium sp. C2-6-12]|uniref:SH3 domain-containing protein n=1 Tax=Clostridium sp. C2-6-12 TaxID=2698832 RepID=UPI00136E07F3|nr:SH3 domain-containing protein [Clostridium sp. C2-6-12]